MPWEVGWHSSSQFVTEGVMIAMPLCFPGQSVPPPSGETAMAAMCADPVGGLYIGTAGRKAHVLAAMVHGESGIIYDLGVIPDATRVDAVATDDEDICVVATGPDGTALWRNERFSRDFLIQEWGFKRHPYRKVAPLELAGCPAGLITDRSAKELTFFGLTAPDGQLFSLDVASGETRVLATLGETPASARIAADAAGRIWGGDPAGCLWVCDPQSGQVETIGGEGVGGCTTAMALDGHTGTLYAAAGGKLFVIDTEKRCVTALGKPAQWDEIPCMVVSNDGRVFGMAGGEDDLGHLFSYDPADGQSADLAIPVSVIGERQYGYHFACAMMGPGGEIYFGQHERVNHLWLYFPTVQPRRA